jgi:hypothetical protein
MKLENQTILIVSNEPWGDVWYSKHNWAFELAKKNNVFFINPPKKWTWKNFLGSFISTKKYTENLQILNYNNTLPFTRFSIIYHINNIIISYRLKNWFSKNNITSYIFWTFDPYRLSNPKLLNPLFSIYFIADKYTIKREFELIKNVDFFFSVSNVLTERLVLENPLVLSHGIAETEFNSEAPIEIDEEFILYVGSIDYRLDSAFVKKLVEQFPQERFVFIGKLVPTDEEIFTELFLDKKHENLVYHLPIHFKELKNYIAKAKICLAPMQLEVAGNNINHHKLLQYLAQGRPVVSASFKDYEESDIIHAYQSHEEGIKIMTELIHNEEEKHIIENRINFAQQFTYNKLIQKIEVFLSEQRL